MFHTHSGYKTEPILAVLVVCSCILLGCYFVSVRAGDQFTYINHYLFESSNSCILRINCDNNISQIVHQHLHKQTLTAVRQRFICEDEVTRSSYRSDRDWFQGSTVMYVELKISRTEHNFLANNNTFGICTAFLSSRCSLYDTCRVIANRRRIDSTRHGLTNYEPFERRVEWLC